MLCTSFRWVVPTFWTHVSWRRIGSWRFGLFCPSLHWSQILRFVTNAGSGSRILRLRRKIPLLFGEKSFETVCFDSFILKQALKQTRSVCLRLFPPKSHERFGL